MVYWSLGVVVSTTVPTCPLVMAGITRIFTAWTGKMDYTEEKRLLVNK